MTLCSYSVQSNTSNSCSGGYEVTIDSVVASQSAVNSNNPISKSASDTHKFFVSKIGLNFYTGTWSSYSSTGSGSMKYILGS